jgi:hypothetical protein
VATVLPPSPEFSEALVSLLPSPLWNPWKAGIAIQVFGLTSAPPEMESAVIENLAPIHVQLLTYARHLLSRETFSFWSINYIHGYRMCGVQLPLLGAVVLIALAAWWLRRRWPVHLAVAGAALAVILLLQLRFTTDLALATVSDIARWRRDGTIADFGDAPGEAAFLIHLHAKQPVQGVVVCGTMTSALKYFLFPIPAENPSPPVWNSASHAILSMPWKSADGLIHCADMPPRPGTIIQTFPEGGAVAAFTPPAP